jgi:hypothetical protein
LEAENPAVYKPSAPLCYKPMFVSGASSVRSIFRIIDAFRGTLILDESNFRASDERAAIRQKNPQQPKCRWTSRAAQRGYPDSRV